MNTLKEKYFAVYNRFVSKGFYKAESFLANAIAVLIGLIPDLINFVLTNWSMVDAGLPTLSAEHKLYLFATANVLAMFLRARKQKNMQPGEDPPIQQVKEDKAGASG